MRFIGSKALLLDNIKAVSYTHLDVYKRQSLYRPFPKSIIQPIVQKGLRRPMGLL